MSLIGRTTEDYSPLRGPIINPHTNRDMRPRHERQQYEQAVNARREMLHVFDTMPVQKLGKKKYEQLQRIKTPLSGDREIPLDERRKQRVNAEARSRHTMKQLLRGHVLHMLEEASA